MGIKTSSGTRKFYIIFDFDGVLVESNEIRFEGFEVLFKDYPKPEVEKLIRFVKLNAGLSRYDKIKHFFEKIRKESISPAKINRLSKRYTVLVKKKIIEAKPVKGSLEFLSCYHDKYKFAIISGSDEKELKEVCSARKIGHFFIAIKGSPKNKESNISKLLAEMKWEKKHCIFVGDSTNDLEAAQVNGIDFIARDSNIIDWSSRGVPVIEDLSQLSSCL